VVGRRRADAGLARHGAERERRRTLRLEDPPGGVDEGAAQVAVVVGPGFGGLRFSHGVSTLIDIWTT
jgi:hypothetical protein